MNFGIIPAHLRGSDRKRTFSTKPALNSIISSFAPLVDGGISNELIKQIQDFVEWLAKNPNKRLIPQEICAQEELMALLSKIITNSESGIDVQAVREVFQGAIDEISPLIIEVEPDHPGIDEVRERWERHGDAEVES